MKTELENKKLSKLKNWLRKPQSKIWLAVGLVAIILLIVVGTVAYKRYYKTDEQPTQSTEEKDRVKNIVQEEKPELNPSILDGVLVKPELANRRPLAVMVENHPQARPQAGLEQASQVWEIIVEGGITRFMAIYSATSAEKIGPVRSARTFFVDYASGYHALYAHAGGAQGALALLAGNQYVVDLPHTQGYFEREPKPGIATEHTLFTTTQNLYDFATAKEVSLEADFDAFKFKDEASKADRGDTKRVTVPFSTETYQADWDYDSEANVYSRSLAGQPHIDRVTSNQIKVKNLIVLTVNRHFTPNINGGKGEWSMDTTGSGPAKVFQNGKMIEATWKKDSAGSMVKFYDGANQEIALTRGKTWFSVVPPDVTINHQKTEPAAQ